MSANSDSNQKPLASPSSAASHESIAAGAFSGVSGVVSISP